MKFMIIFQINRFTNMLFFKQQPHIFNNPKVKTSKRTKRWYKNAGLGFKTPKTAIEGSYIDKKCPFTGLVSIRGKILTGTVVSTKMHRTIVIRRAYLHYIPKYNRYEKRHKNVPVHVSQLSVSKLVTSLPSANVDQSPRLLDSTLSRSLLLLVRLTNNLLNFKLVMNQHKTYVTVYFIIICIMY